MTLFIKDIFRSKYLRNNIRNQLLHDKTIKVSLSFIEKEYETLSKLNCTAFNIKIHLLIKSIDQYQLYINSPYRHLVNSIQFCKFKVSEDQLLESLDLLPLEITDLDISVVDLPVNSSFSNNSALKRLKIRLSKELKIESLPKDLNVLQLKSYNHRIPRLLFEMKQLKTLAITITNLENTNFSDLYQPVNSDIRVELKLKLDTFINIDNFENIKNMNLTNLYIFNIDEVKFKPGDLPTTITTLKMSYYDVIEPGIIPNSVTDFELLNFCSTPLQGSLPDSITILRLLEYHGSIDIGVLPKSLTHLESLFFNQPLKVGSLPNSLKHLALDCFNQPILPGLLPNSLTHIGLKSINQELKGILPISCQQLDISGSKFPLTMDVLPFNLTKLTINQKSIEYINLPNSITDLIVYGYDESISLDSFNSNLKKLELFSTLKALQKPLPESIQLLELNGIHLTSVSNQVIPKSLEKLIINNTRFDLASIQHTSVKTLELPIKVTNNLPKSLINLIIDNTFESF
ncbi:hypothetical protein CYY_007296 [Polysphondylium violaceum]|uniref:FNIP repeat-containing protein n=1 Tax=Polysphondylium violaceum TaxID=133409 RepID=A0A8J4PNT8_9MYCE|nr:hypothetical protein CYY_007296 [Polysphondylium violaceum]